MTSDKKSGMAKKSTVPTANLKIVVSNIVSVLASVCWMKSDYHTLISIARFIRKIPINERPKMIK